MDSNTLLLAILLVAVLVAIGLLILLMLRRPEERIGGLLRDEQRAGRGELREQLDGFALQQGQRIDGFGGQLQAVAARTDQRLDEFTLRTDARLDELRAALSEDARKSRSEAAEQQQRHADALGQKLQDLTQRNEQRIGEMRSTLEQQLKALQADNAQKLEQMRATVDEKLQSTLETRLGQSFKLVSERLEAVQRGLGEMQTLAAGVGDLKRVLTNVKDRGGWGEIQLETLLQQVLTAEQFARSVKVRPGSNEAVDFAIRLPGQQDGGVPVWLPIDAKFPREDYERLLDAQERADAEAARGAGDALERRVRQEAARIRDKYVSPPHTTEFAILFLPTEGLYAEVLRRPGLVDALQRDLRIASVSPRSCASSRRS